MGTQFTAKAVESHPAMEAMERGKNPIVEGSLRLQEVGLRLAGHHTSWGPEDLAIG